MSFCEHKAKRGIVYRGDRYDKRSVAEAASVFFNEKIVRCYGILDSWKYTTHSASSL